MEKRVDQLMGPDRGDGPTRPTPSIQVTNDTMSTLSSPSSLPLSSPQKTSISRFLVRDESGQRSITSFGSQQLIGSTTDYAGTDASEKNAEPASSSMSEQKVQAQAQTSLPQQAEPSREPSQPSFSERTSQTPSHTAERLNGGLSERSVERPSTQDPPSMSETRKYDDEPYDFSKFEPKPKVKLGPRPVAFGEKTKRSMVANVSALPATIRPSPKKQEPIRPDSQGPMSLHAPAPAPPVLLRPPPVPDMPEYNPRPVSRGSIKSLPSHKSTQMTPDKLRLMKAVELRRKQLRKSNPQQSFIPPKDDTSPIPQAAVAPQSASRKSPETVPEQETQVDDVEQRVPSKKADSGIEMGYERPEKYAKIETAEGTRSPATEPAADPETLASAPLGRQSLRLDTSGPPSTQQLSSSEYAVEPTMSLDMLEDPPRPAFSHLQVSSATDSPTLGRVREGLDNTRAPLQHASRVPTIVMADGSRPVSSNGQQAPPALTSLQQHESEVAGADGDTSGSDLLDQFPLSPRHHHGHHDDLAKRRQGIVEPLTIDPDGEFNSDDEFLEELHSATFQEAKPMTVTSPMGAPSRRRPSAQSLVSNHSVASVKSINIRRSSSNLLEQFNASQDLASPDTYATSPLRSGTLSTPLSTPPLEPGESSPGLKRNLSTGISKRIQALAEVSSREASTTSRPLTPETMTQNTWRERKSAVRSPPTSRTSSFKSIARQSSRTSGFTSSGNTTPGTNGFQQPEPVWTVQHDPVSNRDSVSVSARIVRNHTGVGADDAAQADGSLQQSQLVVNHKRASAPTSNIDRALPPLNTNISGPLKSASVPSVTAHSPTMTRGPTEYRTLHSTQSRKSFGRYRQQAMSPMSPSPEDFPPPPSNAVTSRASIASSTDEHAAPKEGTRTSRFFKRMSTLGGSGHKSRGSGQLPANMVVRDDMPSHAQRSNSVANTDKSDMPPPVVVGELNSQFPDSLVSTPLSTTHCNADS